MAVKMTITRIHAREILDSRGNPTIEVEVLAGDEFLGRAAVRQHLPEPAPENLKPLN